jgi:hypothetical protein
LYYLRVFITLLRVMLRTRCAELFGRECEAFARVLDHLPHFADALGALGRAAVAGEDVARALGAGLNGSGDIPLAKAVAVADVHVESPTKPRLIIILYSG